MCFFIMSILKKNKKLDSLNVASGSILWKNFERSDLKNILFEIFRPLKESKPGEVSNDNILLPPKENEDRYTSTPERTRIDAKGYPFLETSYPPSRFKSYFVQKILKLKFFLSS